MRKSGVEAGVWPGAHEKWRMDGWLTSQYWSVDQMAFIVRAAVSEWE